MTSNIKWLHFLGRCLWVFLIILVVLWLAMQILFKPAIGMIAGRIIGAKVSIGTFNINPFSRQIHLTHLQIYNEQGFPDKIFFDASQIVVDVDVPELIKGKMHFPLVVFSLEKMIVFKNKQGKLNVNELKIVQEKLHEKKKGPMPDFKIDELRLDIEKVVVEDDSTPPVITAYDLNLKGKTIKNIDGVPKLVGSILFEALKPTAIQGAGMFAAETLMGIGFLPGLAIGVAIAKDDDSADLSRSLHEVYNHSLELVKSLGGKIKKEDRANGQIIASVYNCDIIIKIQSLGWNRSQIVIKARKYFIAKPEIAAGLLYQLKEQLQ